MTTNDSLTVASYSKEGEFIGCDTVLPADLNQEHIEFFEDQFEHLTFDLELPLEGAFPGNDPFMEFRICSSIGGAYVMYYFHDEVIFSSLLISGKYSEEESELLHVFRYVVIENEEESADEKEAAEELTEEEIEHKLKTSSKFDFSKITELPVAYEIPSHREDEAEQFEFARKMNQHLAAAFFNIVLDDEEVL